jgi:hypothetical protein
MFHLAADVDRCANHSSSVTFVLPFLNMSLHSHMLCCSKTVTHHTVLIVCYAFLQVTLPAHKKLVTACCSSLVHVVSEDAVLMMLMVQEN